jgi:hypothetical protein
MEIIVIHGRDGYQTVKLADADGTVREEATLHQAQILSIDLGGTRQDAITFGQPEAEPAPPPVQVEEEE